MKPFLKWAGGKNSLKKKIADLVRTKHSFDSTYYEPFVGAGSVFFELGFPKAVINDKNKELINCYRIVKKNPEKLILALKKHENHHSDKYFYQIREIDRDKNEYKKLNNIEKAARLIYLNKTCFNGLFRVNRKGEFNTPVGRYKKPLIVDEFNFRTLSQYFRKNIIKFKNGDFKKCLKIAKKGDVIYFDPPYDYEKRGFTAYHQDGFNFDNLIDLKNECDRLIDLGCYVFISNNATKRVLELFSNNNYKIFYSVENPIQVQRFISGKSIGRIKANEVLISGEKK